MASKISVLDADKSSFIELVLSGSSESPGSSVIVDCFDIAEAIADIGGGRDNPDFSVADVDFLGKVQSYMKQLGFVGEISKLHAFDFVQKIFNAEAEALKKLGGDSPKQEG